MSLFAQVITYVITIVIGLFVSSVSLLAQYRVTIDDLLHDPERFYGLTIRLTGKVVNVFTGGYTIQNDTGLLVDVGSKKSPIIDEKYDVTVMVEKNPDSPAPLLTEIKRSKQGQGYSWLLLFFLLLFLGVMSGSGGK